MANCFWHLGTLGETAFVPVAKVTTNMRSSWSLGVGREFRGAALHVGFRVQVLPRSGCWGGASSRGRSRRPQFLPPLRVLLPQPSASVIPETPERARWTPHSPLGQQRNAQGTRGRWKFQITDVLQHPGHTYTGTKICNSAIHPIRHLMFDLAALLRPHLRSGT